MNETPKKHNEYYSLSSVFCWDTLPTEVQRSMCMNKIFTYFPNSFDSYKIGDHASMERRSNSNEKLAVAFPQAYWTAELHVQSFCQKANTSPINQHFLENFMLEHLVCMDVKASGLNVNTKGA